MRKAKVINFRAFSSEGASHYRLHFGRHSPLGRRVGQKERLRATRSGLVEGCCHQAAISTMSESGSMENKVTICD